MDNKSIWQDLFEFDFENLITMRVIRLLYFISVIVAVIIAVGIIICGFKDSFFWGLIKLVIIAPITFFLIVCCSRIILEVIIVIFKISDNINFIAESKKISKEESDSSFDA